MAAELDSGIGETDPEAELIEEVWAMVEAGLLATVAEGLSEEAVPEVATDVLAEDVEGEYDEPAWTVVSEEVDEASGIEPSFEGADGRFVVLACGKDWCAEVRGLEDAGVLAALLMLPSVCRVGDREETVGVREWPDSAAVGAGTVQPEPSEGYGVGPEYVRGRCMMLYAVSGMLWVSVRARPSPAVLMVATGLREVVHAL